MNRKVRTAMVGCGKVAHLHAAALGELPEAEFVAVTDADFERAGEFAARYRVRAYADLDSLIEDCHVEAVIVCTPHPAHRAPAVRAAEAGIHVLVEKPLAASLSDCDAMIEVAARHKVKLGVVSQRRFFAPVSRMKAAIDAGKIGAPVLGTVAMFSWRDENYYRSDPWRGKWDTEGGGVLINQSPHHLDILQWLMGPVDEVSGYHANLNHPYIEVEDTALAMIRFRSGALASVVVSLSQKPGIYTKIHVHGANGASVGAETDSGATFIAGMTAVAAPPLNDLWTIPGEEALLPAFQEEDRAVFGSSTPARIITPRRTATFCARFLRTARLWQPARMAAKSWRSSRLSIARRNSTGPCGFHWNLWSESEGYLGLPLRISASRLSRYSSYSFFSAGSLGAAIYLLRLVLTLVELLPGPLVVDVGGVGIVQDPSMSCGGMKDTPSGSPTTRSPGNTVTLPIRMGTLRRPPRRHRWRSGERDGNRRAFPFR